jgi:hypothetical protein
LIRGLSAAGFMAIGRGDCAAADQAATLNGTADDRAERAKRQPETTNVRVP